jgi:probable rRNA maturation factor
VIIRRKVTGLTASTLERFVLRARRAVRLRQTVNVLVTSSQELHSLNRQFRGKDRPTDVLSFPASAAPGHPLRQLAGELAISADVARENADRLGHPVAEEIKILALHGILHLAGFDHEHDHGQMARREIQLRQELNLNSSLIERAQTTAKVASDSVRAQNHSSRVSRSKA